MTEPERDRRRPLPALIFILALTVLTALVWFRVLHRADSSANGASATGSACPTVTALPTTSTPPPGGAHRRTLPAPGSVRVLVVNATNRSGLAGRTSTELHRDGFRTATPANDQSAYDGSGVGQIRYAGGEKRAALLVRYYVPGAKLVRLHRHTTTVTVALGDKFTGLRPAAKVTARLRRHHVVLRTHAGTSPPTPAGTTAPAC